MALVVVQTPRMNSGQKERIGEALFDALHQEGFAASRTIILFMPESEDLAASGVVAATPLLAPPPISQNFKTRARRTKAELLEMKKRLVLALQSSQTLTSLQARKQLGLTNCDWAPAALRRFFRELEDQGLVIQQGLKRGTCYAWKGPKAS